MRHTAGMKRSMSKIVVGIIVVAIVGVVALALNLRTRLRCSGFAGPGVTAEELPAQGPAQGELRIAHFNIRNFPLDERPPRPDLGFSRRTNICDLEVALTGLDAQVLGFTEICDTRRFPPILRRSGGEKPMRIFFSRDGGGGGQHLAIAWDAGGIELVEGPVEITELIVKPGLRPGLAVRLKTLEDPAVDFTVVEVHLDSGIDDLEYRLAQVEALAEWVDRWVGDSGDPDVILQGDFNTMGSRDISPAQELRFVDAILAEAGFVRVDNATGCTQYWEGPGQADGIHRASLLDLVYIRGLTATGPARSWLHCERFQCGELISRPGDEDGTFFDVSDHCPVTFEVQIGEE